MNPQEEGLLGRMVGGMIRRSVRNRFHSVWWSGPNQIPETPAIFYANHHGWMDGYLLFHLVQAIERPSVDWIQEFDAFPLFRYVGGMRFAEGDLQGRVATVRKTIELLRERKRSLIIFPEGLMHRPPGVLEFGKALQTVAQSVPGVRLVPVAIRYELAMHERPEAWISLGAPHSFESLSDCRERLVEHLDSLGCAVRSGATFELLVKGTPDVNERMSLKRFAK